MLVPVTVGTNPPQEDPHAASWAVRALQKARENLIKEWADAWALRAIAYNQAIAAISKRDKDFYAHAQQQWLDAGKAQKKVTDDMAVNDKLRRDLLAQVQGKLNLTTDALAWFQQAYGLQPPDAYNGAKGGTVIPRFPEFS